MKKTHSTFSIAFFLFLCLSVPNVSSQTTTLHIQIRNDLFGTYNFGGRGAFLAYTTLTVFLLSEVQGSLNFELKLTQAKLQSSSHTINLTTITEIDGSTTSLSYGEISYGDTLTLEFKENVCGYTIGSSIGFSTLSDEIFHLEIIEEYDVQQIECSPQKKFSNLEITILAIVPVITLIYGVIKLQKYVKN